MKNRRLSARAVVSLMLSAILFCMPIGAFFANRANTVEVHAEDTAEQKTESAAEEGSAESTASGTDNKDSSGSGENHTEQSTENTTENSTEGTTEETQPAAKCTCKEKCSQYAVNEDCEVCAKDYKECAYINPSVKITINTPSGWHNDTTKVKVNGAAAILNDDIRQEIAEKVGDFYMLPSSIHETLIIPKDAGMEFKELEQMVQEVNQTQVAPGERLSDHVYEYDAKEHELFRSDRAEERAKQKEEKGDNRHERVSVKEKLAEKKDAVIKMNAGKEHSALEKKKEAVI